MRQEYTVKEILDFIKGNIWRLLFGAIVGGIVGYLVMYYLVTPMYTSQAQLLVSQNQVMADGQTARPIEYNQIQSNLQLINTYRDIVKADSTLYLVSQELEEDYSVEEIRSALNISQSTNSQAFTIRATIDSPEAAQNIVNKVVEVFETQVEKYYPDNPTNIFVLSNASYEPNKVSPNTYLYIVMGSVLGLLITMLFRLIKLMSDTTVKSSANIEALGIINLGEVTSMSNRVRKNSRIKITKTGDLIHRKV